jgi:hypothetical protein
MKHKIFFTLVFTIVLTMFIFPSFTTAQDFVGTYRIDIPASVRSNVDKQNIGNQTVRRTDSISMTGGAKGAGTLEIKADGTYAIRGHIGYGDLKTGKWIVIKEGKFSDRGGIELLETKSKDYGERSWFIIINDEGEVEAWEPPYLKTTTLLLTKISGKPVASSKTEPPINKVTDSADGKSSEQKSASVDQHQSAEKTSSKVRRWTVAEFRKSFEGKTPEEVEAVLGKPAEVSYKTWTYGGLQIIDENDKNAVRTKAYISFTEVKGGTVWHMSFF